MSSVVPVPQRTESLLFDCVETQVSFLLGHVLTVVDASTSGEQNKAMKDLIRQAFNRQVGHMRSIAYGDAASSNSTSGGESARHRERAGR